MPESITATAIFSPVKEPLPSVSLPSFFNPIEPRSTSPSVKRPLWAAITMASVEMRATRLSSARLKIAAAVAFATIMFPPG